MANFTTELRTIVEHYGNNNEVGNYQDIDIAINKALPYIFDDFNIFDDNYRIALETKIIKHFYTREIAYETVPLWKFKLNTKLAEIMPLYNQLYKSELLKFNPFYDIDIYTEHTKDNKSDATNTANSTDNTSDNRNTDRVIDRSTNEDRNQNSTDNTTTNSTSNRDNTSNTKDTSQTDSNNQTSNDSKTGDISRDLYSETPQGGLEGLENGNYLTNARKTADDTHTVESGNQVNSEKSESDRIANSNEKSSSNDVSNKIGTIDQTANTKEDVAESTEDKYQSNRASNSVANSNIKSTEDYLQHVYGKTGNTNYNQLLLDFRKTFLNIDMMIIEELEPLFMGLYC